MYVEQITKHLLSASNPEIAQHSQRFFKTAQGEYGEGDKFIGIRIPIIRQTLKDFKEATLSDALTLLQSEYHEIRLFAVLLLVRLYEKAKSDPNQQDAIVESYLANTQYINNWDIVDSSAHKILGHYYLNKDKSVLHELSRSDNLWEKRISMMATYTFIKSLHFEDTFIIAKRLLNDNHDLIHKIVGWMLREVGNKNKEAEVEFLQLHYKKMPRTMLRYAIEKFSKDERKAYLNGEV